MASPLVINFEVEEAGESARELPARSWASSIAGSWVLRGVALCAATLVIARFTFRYHVSDDPIVGVPGRNRLSLMEPKKLAPEDRVSKVDAIAGENKEVSQEEPGSYPPLGSDKDPHGCIGSAGYRFCPFNHKCQHPWSSECEGGFEGDVHCAPSRRAFPRHWGAPPNFVLDGEDLTPTQLPADAGEGTSTLAKWMQMHLNAGAGCELDAAAADVVHYTENGQALPQCWGAPPELQNVDVVALPSVFGSGSSTLQEWIQGNLVSDEVNQEASATVHYSPDDKVAFPLLWQAPPVAQDMDMVPLPCNCGEGSNTLQKWISRHMADDAECTAVYYRTDGTCSLEMGPESEGPPRVVAF